MNWIYKDNPCVGCTDRPLDRGCGMHSSCEKYAKWVAEKDERKNQKYLGNQREKMLDDFLVGGNKKRREKAVGNKK